MCSKHLNQEKMLRNTKTYNLLVPTDCYPRYKYTCRHAGTLFRQYGNILDTLGINDNTEIPPLGDVNILFWCRNKQSRIDVKHVCRSNSDTVKCKLLTNEERLSSFRTLETQDSTIVVAPDELHEDLENEPELMGKRILLITNKESQNELSSTSSNYQINTSSLENLAENIDILSERVVLESLSKRMPVLESLLSLEDFTLSLNALDAALTSKSGLPGEMTLDWEGALKLWWEARLDTVKTQIDERFKSASPEFRLNLIKILTERTKAVDRFPEHQMLKDILPRMKTSAPKGESRRQVQRKIRDLKTVYNLIREVEQLQSAYKSLLEQVQNQNNDIEQLYGDIKGMLYRSKISMKPNGVAMNRILDERVAKPILTNGIDMCRVLDEKVAKQVLSINGVISVGYRFRTLDVFLDASLKDEEKKTTEGKLKQTLAKENILKFAFHYEQREITPFREVGSTIKIHSKGTLGGFAKLGKEEDTCVLLARHLIEQSDLTHSDGSVFVQNSPNSEEMSPFAKCLAPRNQMERYASLDIAIAKVLPQERAKCNVKFKDDSGNCLPSTLCLFDDFEWLNGLPVHIWRGTGPPGLGVIRIPNLYMKDMENKLLKIEDRERDQRQEIERFAKEGDSGAVVCATDNSGTTVHAIAMLMGSSNHKDVKNNPARKQQYVAFRLVEGLSQIRHEQQKDVSLF